MKEIVYREARLDEYQKIGKVLAGAFMDYPFMTLIKDDLKKPEYYQAFLELLDSLLTRLYIKGETCLIAEQDGEIMAVALLQQKDFSILSYLLNGMVKLFRFITPRNLLKYLDLVERSEQHLRGNPMKLINTTNSHSQLVKSQLESTDATLVEVYSAGNTDVIFTQAPLHYEILISNKHRAIREKEMEIIKEFFLNRKINQQAIDKANIKTLYSDKLIEISIPTK